MELKNSQQQGPVGSLKATAGLMVWAAETVSLPIELLCHERVGLRFAGVRGALAAMLVVAYSLPFAGQDLRPLYAFLLLYLCRCWAHGAVWFYRTWKRMPLPPLTTYYPGDPLLGRLLPRQSDGSLRRLEVLLVFAAGVGACALNPPLGAYLAASAVGLGFTLYLRYMATMKRIWDLHDATVVQKNVAEGFRELSGG